MRADGPASPLGTTNRSLVRGATRRKCVSMSRETKAFSLIEILLAVALLGLLSAVMVSVAVRFVDGKPKAPEEIFWEAARTARRSALTSEREVWLSYDPKEKGFLLEGGTGGKKFPVPENRDLTID